MSRAAVLAAAFLWCAAASAAPQPFRFVTLVFPPLEFEDANKQATGAAVEVVKEAMTTLGHPVEVEVLPWSRALNLVKEGKADAIFTAYRTAEREAFLNFGKEVLVPQVVSLYIKKGSGRTFKGDLRELVGFTVGILSTISYGNAFDEAKTKLALKTDRVESLDLNFKKLAAGRIDYVISNRYSAHVEIEGLGMDNQIIELPTPVEVTPSYVGWTKKKDLSALRDAFDKELRRMKKSGRYSTIMEKWKVRMPQAS